ncbi:hypothetical protein DYB31_000543 [Aphanomyces astaci]|uniref:EF-hand domain-containing protein n=1 Tax=Aphanomyces astaci TaxID=112090 RepID=A0A397EHP0_APHAT|nr:hypothetical protein DYB31_000543 [Aphanomyces astaci]
MHVELLSGTKARPYSDNVIYTSPVWNNALKAGKLEESFASCDMEMLVEGAALSSESEGDDDLTKQNVKPESDRDAWLRELYQKAQMDAALARTLQAPLQKSTSTSPTKRSSPPQHPPRALDLHDVPTTVITDDPTPSHELSRASKSLLTRHGFYDTVTSVPMEDNNRPNQHSSASGMHRPLPPLKTVADELRDGLNLLEITFQFAAFRALSESGGQPSPLPTSMYFTFQFYTFEPTKSERLLVTSTPAAATYLLCRDHAKKPSLAIQFDLHTTKQCPLEAAAFATYLLTKSLHVDVWDGESLLPLGSMTVPLHDLMRQGNRVKKYHAEFDVRRSADFSMMSPATTSSIPSSMGAVQLLMSNFASTSSACPPAVVRPIDNPREAGNWRFAPPPPSSDSALLQKGPRHRVRAKPLADSNEELRQLLVREHLYDPDPGNHRSSKLRENSSQSRGHSDATSITKDEIERLCRRFQSQATRNNRLDAAALLALFSMAPSSTKQEKAAFALAEDIRQAFLNAFARGTDFREMFAALDGNGDGTVTTAEFIEGFHALSADFRACAPQSLRAVVDSFDSNHDGRINYMEFMAFLNKHLHLSIRQELQAVFVRAAQRGVDVAALFRQLDTSGDGQLTPREFETALKHIGFVVKDRNEFDAFCRSLDDDGNGSVSYIEFIRHMGLQTLATDGVLTTLLAILKRTIAKGIDVVELFLHMDSDGSGAVSYAELMKVLTDLDLDRQLSAAMLQDIVLRVDKDKSGSIDIAEFLAFVQIPFDAAKMIQTRLHRILTRAADQGVSVRDAFSQFDHDGSGEVSAVEFQAALQSLKCPLSPADLAVVLAKCDVNRDGSVSYKEFLAFVFGNQQDATKVLAKPIQVQLATLFQDASAKGVDLSQCFAHFDKDGSREISTSEFMAALKELGMAHVDEEDTMRAIVAFLDKNHDGKINYDEFVALATPRTRDRQVPPPVKLFNMLTQALADGVDVESAFGHFDKTGSGSVSHADFRSALNELGTVQWTTSEMDAIFQHLDKDGGGTVSLREFQTFLQLTPAKRVRALLVKAHGQGVALAQSFGHFTATDGIDLAAFETGLVKLQFTDFTKQDILGLFGSINTSTSGRISIEELSAFVGVPSAATTNELPGFSPMDKLKELLLRAQSQGVDVGASFGHFDKNGDGTITYDELDVALKQLNFTDFTADDVASIRRALDKDHSGTISLDEFQKLYGENKNMSANKPPKKVQEKAGTQQRRPPLSKQASTTSQLHLKKLHDLLLKAKDQGIDIADAFAQFDTNGNGVISYDEFDATLVKLGFDGLTPPDLADIRKAVDRDKSGSISLDDFKALYEPPKISAGGDGGASTKPWLAKKGSKGAPSVKTQAAPNAMLSGVAKLGEFLRLAKGKGIDVDLAFGHFDTDGNGNISYDEFSAALAALNLDAITENDVLEIRTALDKDKSGSISLEEFKKLYATESTVVAESATTMEPLAKLCALLQKALSAGIDIHQAFGHFDGDGNGTITRAEFASAMTALQLDGLTNADVAEITTALDIDNSGSISLQEFQKLYAITTPPEPTKPMEVESTKSSTAEQPTADEDRKGLEGMERSKAIARMGSETADEKSSSDTKDVSKDNALVSKQTPSAKNILADKSALDKLRELLGRAKAGGVDIDQAFLHFDADQSGSISYTEFDAAILVLHLDSLTEADLVAIRSALDTDKSGAISLVEFKRLYAEPTSVPAIAVEATEVPTQPHEEGGVHKVGGGNPCENPEIQKLTRLLVEARGNGADVAKAFAASDSNGKVTYVEFDAALLELGLDDITEEEIVAIRTHLDRENLGVISYQKIQALWTTRSVHPDKLSGDKTSNPPSRGGSTKSMKSASTTGSDVENTSLKKQESKSKEPSDSKEQQKDDMDPGTKEPAESPSESKAKEGPSTSLEMLRALLVRAKDSGVNIDQAFLHFDKDGSGTITHAEFKGGLAELHLEGFSDHDVDSVMQMLDKDNSGSISLQEFKKLYKPPPKPVRDSSKSAKKPWLTKKASKSLAPPSDDVVQTKKDERSPHSDVKGSGGVSVAAVTKLSDLLLRAKEKGVNIAAAFSHFDADGDGVISTAEFATGLASLQFDLSAEEVATIQSHLDRDNSGTMSLDEFKSLYVNPKVSKTNSNSTKASDSDKPKKPPSGLGKRPSVAASRRQSAKPEQPTNSPLLDQLQKVLAMAKVKGVDVDQAFAHFDSDGDGNVTYAEFDHALAELGIVHEAADAEHIHALLDKDKGGTISMTEFKHLYASKSTATPTPATSKKQPPVVAANLESRRASAKAGVEAGGITSHMETLRKLLLRAQAKGVDVHQSFAHFDKDGDGSVSYDEFALALKELQLEMKAEDMAPLCNALDKDGSGSISLSEFRKLYQAVPPLSRLPSTGVTDAKKTSARVSARTSKPPVSDVDTSSHESSKPSQSQPSVRTNLSSHRSTGDDKPDATSSRRLIDKTNDLSEPEYRFSTEPEVRILEIKLRKAAIAALARGVPATSLLGKYTQKPTGEVLRVDFVQFLMELGLSVIDDLGSGGYVCDVPTMMHDKVYARQLERLRQFRHETNRQTSKSQRELVRAASMSNRLGRKEHGGQARVVEAFVAQKNKMLQVVQYYRDGHKKAIIHALLRDHVTTSIHVFPRFGTMMFFEFPVRNPYGHAERFRIEWQDAELMLVLDAVEWRYYRDRVPVCVDMGDGRGDIEADMIDDMHEILLEGGDAVVLPFRLMTLQTHKQARVVPVYVKSVAHGHVVSVLQVHIQPLPFVCHRTHRLFHAAGGILRRCLKFMSPLEDDDHDSLHPNQPRRHRSREKFVACPDAGVVVETNPVEHKHMPQEIYFKYRVGEYPSSGEFYLLLYEDMYHAVLYEIWRLCVQLDLHATMGQGVRNELILKGDTMPRRVRCYSSQPAKVHRIFQLLPHAFNRIELLYCSMDVGALQVLINVKISYRNPWESDRMFVLRTSDPSIMKPREPTLRLSGGSDGFLRLAFAPYSIPCTKKVYLFINDGSDQNEECLLLHIIWTDHRD